MFWQLLAIFHMSLFNHIFPEEPKIRNSLLYSHSPGSSTDILFTGNGATCRSVQGPFRTVSEGNADSAGGHVGRWQDWASVTGTSIRVLSFPALMLSSTGRHGGGHGYKARAQNTCQEILFCDPGERGSSSRPPAIFFSQQMMHSRERMT